MAPLLRIALITCLTVLALYEVALRIAEPAVDRGENQFATNAIRLENYVDRGVKARSVVVGTSLSARILPNDLPQGWQILSQEGGSTLTGLDVVALTSPLPTQVLVESNYLGNPASADNIANATGMVQRRIRGLLWLSRQAYRPMNILVWVLRRSVRPDPATEYPPVNRSELLAVQRSNFASPPSPSIRSGIEQARAKIDRLQKAGVNVMLFELPIDRELEHTPFAEGMRRNLEALFPKTTFCWLSVNDAGEWNTIDGIHLLAQDARRAAARLSNGRCSN